MERPHIEEKLTEELEEVRERHPSLDEQLDDYRRRRREYEEQRGSQSSGATRQRAAGARPRYNV
jgi:flagellar biosynthesis chaperone FliJ